MLKKKKKKNASFVIVKLFCQLPEMISILVLWFELQLTSYFRNQSE